MALGSISTRLRQVLRLKSNMCCKAVSKHMDTQIKKKKKTPNASNSPLIGFHVHYVQVVLA